MSRNNQLKYLLPHQLEALNYIRVYANRKSTDSLSTIRSILNRNGINEKDYEEAIKQLQRYGQIVLSFHPERLSRNNQIVLQGLLQDGIYRSQFETGISSGSPSAYPNGERDIWEKRLFGGAYHVSGVFADDRPKYGALEIMYHPDGAAPRFGSCYFLLCSDVSKRSTFTFGGSHEDLALDRAGTLSAIDSVMAALLTEVEKGHGALGVNNLTVSDLLIQLANGPSSPLSNQSKRPLGRALDSFIEAQVHGTINLDRDVDRLIADPAFCGSPIEELFIKICSKYNIILDWHPGFVLPASKVPVYFRGFATKALANRIVGDGILDAQRIGAAANSLYLEPDKWIEMGSYDDALACFRRLWHVLVKYGMPANNLKNR